MTPRTTQCEVFWALLSSSEHSGVPEDSQPSTFPSVGLHPHTWPKWGCDKPQHNDLRLRKNQKLSPRFCGPFIKVNIFAKEAYKLDLPKNQEIHDEFHVSLLRKYVFHLVYALFGLLPKTMDEG